NKKRFETPFRGRNEGPDPDQLASRWPIRCPGRMLWQRNIAPHQNARFNSPPSPSQRLQWLFKTHHFSWYLSPFTELTRTHNAERPTIRDPRLLDLTCGVSPCLSD